MGFCNLDSVTSQIAYLIVQHRWIVYSRWSAEIFGNVNKLQNQLRHMPLNRAAKRVAAAPSHPGTAEAPCSSRSARRPAAHRRSALPPRSPPRGGHSTGSHGYTQSCTHRRRQGSVDRRRQGNRRQAAAAADTARLWGIA